MVLVLVLGLVLLVVSKVNSGDGLSSLFGGWVDEIEWEGRR